MTAYPDVLDLIPHRPPFVMIDHIIEITGDAIISEKTFHQSDYGTRGHFVLEGILIEVAAQTVAAKQGYENLGCKGEPGRGMLVSIGNLDYCSRAKTGTPLRIFAKKKTQVGNFSILTIAISQDNVTVAKGTIQLFMEP
jgi:predicted hotdog family 3-hydroxylacyl-ACP dehydratase